MARINDGTFRDWKNGDTISSDGYEQDREIIRVAINASDDKIKAHDDLLSKADTGLAPRVETLEETVDMHGQSLGDLSIKVEGDHEQRISDAEQNIYNIEQGNIPTIVNRLEGVDDKNTEQDTRLDVMEGDIYPTLVPVTFAQLQNQNLSFQDYAIGYVDSKLTDIVNLNNFKVQVPETDDTGRLQRAIKHAEDNTGYLLVPAGKTYTYSSTLYIRKALRILGQKGRAIDKTAIWKYTGTGTALEIIYRDGSNNPQMLWGVSIENLCIFRDFTGKYGEVGTGIRMTKVSEFLFKDVQVSGFKVGIDCTESNIMTFDHCIVNYNTYGLWLANKNVDKTVYVTAGNNFINVKDCNFWNNKEAHVVMNNGDNLHFLHNHMEMSAVNFLVDGQFGGDTATFLRNVKITDHNYRTEKDTATSPRFIKFTGSQLMLVSNFTVDNSQIMFLPSVFAGDNGALPSYAIEESLTNVSSVVELTISNIMSFGVKDYFIKGDPNRLDVFLFDKFLIKANPDGSGANIPVYNSNELYPKGFTRNGRKMEFHGTTKLGRENSGAPSLGDIWVQGNYAMFHNGTKSVFLQLALSGTNAERPTNFVLDGFQYFDTTLGKPIWKKGTGWVDSTGATV